MAREGSGCEERRLLYGDTSFSPQSSSFDGTGRTTLNSKIMTVGLGIVLIGLTALAVLQNDASNMEVLDHVLSSYIIIYVLNVNVILAPALNFARLNLEFGTHKDLLVNS